MKSTGLPEVTHILYLFFRKLPFYIDFLFVCLCVPICHRLVLRSEDKSPFAMWVVRLDAGCHSHLVISVAQDRCFLQQDYGFILFMFGFQTYSVQKHDDKLLL